MRGSYPFMRGRTIGHRRFLRLQDKEFQPALRFGELQVEGHVKELCADTVYTWPPDAGERGNVRKAIIDRETEGEPREAHEHPDERTGE